MEAVSYDSLWEPSVVFQTSAAGGRKEEGPGAIGAGAEGHRFGGVAMGVAAALGAEEESYSLEMLGAGTMGSHRVVQAAVPLGTKKVPLQILVSCGGDASRSQVTFRRCSFGVDRHDVRTLVSVVILHDTHPFRLLSVGHHSCGCSQTITIMRYL